MALPKDIAGFSDFRLASIDDIILHLKEWEQDADAVYQKLQRYKDEVELKGLEIEYCGDKWTYLNLFSIGVKNIANELNRLAADIRYSIKKQHIDATKLIYDSILSYDEECKDFKSNQIIGGRKKESILLARLIYSLSRDFTTSIKIHIMRVSKRLDALVGTGSKQYDHKASKDSRLKEHANFKKPEKKSNEDFEKFIRNLELRFESDDQISIKETGKIAKSFTCQSLGFRDNSTIQWSDFIAILEKPPHTYSTGPAHINNLRSKTYDSKQKIIREISNKFIKFLNRQFGIEIPKNYKLFESCPAEKPGTYRLKFKVGFDYGHDRSYYETHFGSLSKTELIDQICMLYEEYQNSNDEEIMEKLKCAMIIADTKHNISKSELLELIKPEEEKHVFDPYENQEDRQPDY